MRKHFLFIVSLALAVSCGRERLESVALPGGVYSVECEGYDNVAEGPVTRSANFDEQSQKVADLNIWVYEHDSNGSAVNAASGYRTYFTTATDIDGDLLFPDPDRTYDIYLFTNVGQITPPATNALAAAYKYGFTSYDTFQSKGFPMAAHYCFKPSDPSQSHSLKVRRLVSKYNVRFNFAGDNDYDFDLHSAYVCQSASSISPFATESGAAAQSEVFRTADFLSVDDLENRGGELYMLENIQRDCFAEGAVRSEKNIKPQKIYISTYLAFEGRLDKHDGTGYNKVTCRYYFGSGTDCAVQRNLVTDLTLNMTNSVEDHDTWIVTPEDPYNNGYLNFYPDMVDIETTGEWYECVAVPFDHDGENPNVRYSLKWNTAEWSSAGISMQICPADGTTWSPYTGTTLQGPYKFRFKSDVSLSAARTSSLTAQICKGTEMEKDEVLPLCVEPHYNTQWQITLVGKLGQTNLNSGYTFSIGNAEGTETYISSPSMQFSSSGTSASIRTSGTATKHLVSTETYRVNITRTYGSTGVKMLNYMGQTINDGIVASRTLYLTGSQLLYGSDDSNNQLSLEFDLFYGQSFTERKIEIHPIYLRLERGKRSPVIVITPSDNDLEYKLTASNENVRVYVGSSSVPYSNETLTGVKNIYLEYVGGTDGSATLTAYSTSGACSCSITLGLVGRLYTNFRDVIWVDEPYYPPGNRRVITFDLVDPDTVVTIWDKDRVHSYSVTAKEGGYFNGTDAPFNDYYVVFWGEGGLWNSRYHKYNNGIMIQFDRRSDIPEATIQIGPEIIQVDQSKFPLY